MVDQSRTGGINGHVAGSARIPCLTRSARRCTASKRGDYRRRPDWRLDRPGPARAQAGGRVVGIGRRKESLAAAQELGCVNETTTSIARGVQQADLVVVCTPVELIPSRLPKRPGTARPGVLHRRGSTKATLFAQREALLHRPIRRPLAVHRQPPDRRQREDRRRRGSRRLVRGRTVVVTPTASTDDRRGRTGSSVLAVARRDTCAHVARPPTMPRWPAPATCRIWWRPPLPPPRRRTAAVNRPAAGATRRASRPATPNCGGKSCWPTLSIPCRPWPILRECFRGCGRPWKRATGKRLAELLEEGKTPP